MSRNMKEEMKIFVFSGTLTPTEGKVDKDLPKPLKYSLAFCLYGIIGFIGYKVMTYCSKQIPCIICQEKWLINGFESMSNFQYL